MIRRLILFLLSRLVPREVRAARSTELDDCEHMKAIGIRGPCYPCWRERREPLPRVAFPEGFSGTTTCRRCNQVGHDVPLEGPRGYNCRVAIGQTDPPFLPWKAESGRSVPASEEPTPVEIKPFESPFKP